MTSPSNESLAALTRALDQAREVLAGVRQEQLTLPTPCGDWDVARLISHLVENTVKFTQSVKGESPDWTTPPAPVTGDWVASFHTAADSLLAAWQQGGEGGAGPDWQTPEIAIHTWDLIRATGQDRQLDPEVAERSLAYMTAGLTPENRGTAFAPAREIAADAPIYDRLAAFAGRDPSWS